MNLTSMQPGTRARLTSVAGDRSFRRRLMELGFLRGTDLRLVRNVAIGGLVEVEIRGCLVTLRHREAEHVLVEEARTEEATP